MTQTQPTVVVGGSVEGNIGSCEVKYTNIPLDSFNKQTVATNSCTGEIISSTTWYDWGYVYMPCMIVLVVFVIIAALRMAFD